MDDIELEDQADEEVFEETSHRACFIFRAGQKYGTGSTPRPTKRRKLNGTSPHISHNVTTSGRNDFSGLAFRRKQLFENFWQQQRTKFQDNNVNQEDVHQLASFLDDLPNTKQDTCLQTALLLTGLDGSAYSAILQALSGQLRDEAHSDSQSNTRVIINIHSRQCPNLQLALKNIIRETIIVHSDVSTYNAFLSDHKKLFPLSFDLELLQRYIRSNNVSQVIVSLCDVETFDGTVTNEIVAAIHLWRKQIPFKLILGITSTIELFEHRLAKSCLRTMNSRIFDFAPHPDLNSDVLRRVQSVNESAHCFYLGPTAITALHEFSHGQGNSIRSLEHMIKFMYMAHCHVNPVSILVDSGNKSLSKDESIVLAQVVRRTESFKTYCEDLLAQKDKTANIKVRTMLESDEDLFAEVRGYIAKGQIIYNSAQSSISELTDLHVMLAQNNLKLKRPRVEIETHLYRGLEDLTDTVIYDETRACIESSSASTLLHVLTRLRELHTPSSWINDSIAILEKAVREVNSTNTKKTSMKSHESISHVKSVLQQLDGMLREASVDVSTLLLHEAYLVSARTTRFKQNFEPQPRAALERALLRPGDYLGCECCSEKYNSNGVTDDPNDIVLNGRQSSQEGSMPPASVLFTLLQEAPTIVNVRDLFDAFQSRIEPNKPMNGASGMEDEQEFLKAAMTQFYTALSELRLIGLVKASTGTQIKKRSTGKSAKPATQDIDFIAKTSWAGL